MLESDRWFFQPIYHQNNHFLLQNITGNGIVTTLKPNQRPQHIQSQIPGRIEQWFVQEGDYVKEGDTIPFPVIF